MKSLLTKVVLTLALGLAGAITPGAVQADDSSVKVPGKVTGDSTADLRLARRRYYYRPYWPGGYYGPYDNPRLYYRQIAPGVYYYF